MRERRSFQGTSCLPLCALCVSVETPSGRTTVPGIETCNSPVCDAGLASVAGEISLIAGSPRSTNITALTRQALPRSYPDGQERGSVCRRERGATYRSAPDLTVDPDLREHRRALCPAKSMRVAS
jgi:hypothetical protein